MNVRYQLIFLMNRYYEEKRG